MIVEHNSNPEGQQSMRGKERNIKGKKKKREREHKKKHMKQNWNQTQETDFF